MISKTLKPLSILFLLPLITSCATIERAAIPKSKLISPDLQKAGAQSQISHQAWDRFLQTYTKLGNDGIVRVDYAAVNEQDKQKLDAYIKDLGDRDASQYTRNAQLAYWINLYNALTVSVILDHYPIDSIRDIKKGLIDVGPWDEKRVVAGGRELSLYDIENGIVRPLWPDDPRTHYALNCAAIGCPNLAQTAYTAGNIMQRLEEKAKLYVNSPRGVSITEDGDLTVSKIYNWYRNDFGRSDEIIINHLRQYADPDLKTALDQSGKINHYVYDWSLNDTSALSQP